MIISSLASWQKIELQTQNVGTVITEILSKKQEFVLCVRSLLVESSVIVQRVLLGKYE